MIIIHVIYDSESGKVRELRVAANPRNDRREKSLCDRRRWLLRLMAGEASSLQRVHSPWNRPRPKYLLFHKFSILPVFFLSDQFRHGYFLKLFW